MLKEAVAVINAMNDGDVSELSSLSDTNEDDSEQPVTTTDEVVNTSTQSASGDKLTGKKKPPNATRGAKVTPNLVSSPLQSLAPRHKLI